MGGGSWEGERRSGGGGRKQRRGEGREGMKMPLYPKKSDVQGEQPEEITEYNK